MKNLAAMTAQFRKLVLGGPRLPHFTSEVSMAQKVTPIIYGVDVCKRTLEVCCHGDSSSVVSVQNERKAIKAWLKQLPQNACLGVETTNTYHCEVVELAIQHGLTVYLIDGYRLSHYRDSVGVRAKTDLTDAQLIARYLAKEREELRPYQLLPAAQQRLWQLLKRRAKVVALMGQLRQSCGELKAVKSSLTAALSKLDNLVLSIEKQLLQLATEQGWREDIARLRTIYGVGPLNALAMVAAFHRGQFQNSDAFVAFLGLDVRVRDSGTYKGKRKLTKKGEAECRRLLFNAARAAARGQAMKPYYSSLIERGFSTTQATVALCRKLARICFSLLKNKSDYRAPILAGG